MEIAEFTSTPERPEEEDDNFDSRTVEEIVLGGTRRLKSCFRGPEQEARGAGRHQVRERVAQRRSLTSLN